MNDEIYQTPKADLLGDNTSSEHKFYVVSKKKLCILFLVTFGLYVVYWFYINWRNQRDFNNAKAIPLLRGIFYIFFTHTLFSLIEKAAKLKLPEFSWPSQLHATMFILLSIISNVAGRLAGKEIGSPMSDAISYLILPFMLYFLCKAQEAVNISQDDPEASSNSHFTVYNYIWIILGALLWLVVVAGLIIIYGGDINF